MTPFEQKIQGKITKTYFVAEGLEIDSAHKAEKAKIEGEK